MSTQVVEDVADAAATVQDPTDKYRGSIFDDDRGEANASAEVGSSGEPDHLDEDVMRDEETRATGFEGNASEVQWLRRLHAGSASNAYEDGPRGPWGPLGLDDDAVNDRMAALRERQDSHPTPTMMPSNKASFYLDDEVLKTDLTVDPFELPPFEISEKLLLSYMESAHNSFPILVKTTFVNRFYHCTSALPITILPVWVRVATFFGIVRPLTPQSSFLTCHRLCIAAT